MPINCTGCGYRNRYFNGMAINNKMTRESPSRNAMIRSLPIFVLSKDTNIIYLIYGLVAKGEKGQGMAIKIMSKASAYHKAMLRNLC